MTDGTPTTDTNNEQQQNQQALEEEEAQQNDPPMIEYVFRWLLIFFAIQMLLNTFNSSRTNQPQPPPEEHSKSQRKPLGVDPVTTTTPTPPLPKVPGSGKTPKSHHYCLWRIGTPMELNVYFSEDANFTRENVLATWHESDLDFGRNPRNERNGTVSISVSERVVRNETHVYGHVFLKRRGGRGGGSGGRKEEDVLYKRVQLTKHRLRKKKRDVKNLLGSRENTTTSSTSTTNDTSPLGLAAQNTTADQMLLYFKPSLTLQLVDFNGPSPRGTLPPQVIDMMDFPFVPPEAASSDDPTKRSTAIAKAALDFYPILHPSEFWIRTDDLIGINGTVDKIDLKVKFTVVKFWKWQIMSSMETQWNTQQSYTGDDTESDFLRTMLHDTNPYLLGITFLVTILHTCFDFLAFKNDITFFRKKKNWEGISLKSMIVNSGFQIIIFLYLVDNDTSFMILVSNGIGLFIEMWKISKAVKVSFQNGAIVWEEIDETYKTSKTKEYDEIATSHLLLVTMPLVGGYGVYSLIHVKHKGYYSWILSTLVGFIYMFGFVMMTPQLFINYKLQSVAHLNWRTMTYKSINTFIDDLFAFVIKMPIMHRLACLRDDIIFFIFLYQGWIYETDYSRVNEYGQCAMPTEEMKKGLEDGTKVEDETKVREVEEEKKKEETNNLAKDDVVEEQGLRRRRGAKDKEQKQRRGARDKNE